MNQHISKMQRIASIALSTNGFGYAVMEGPASFVALGVKGVQGDKNAESLAKAEKLLKFYRPDVLVLQDVNAKGTRRSARIRALHKRMLVLARNRKLKTIQFSKLQVNTALLNDSKATKYDLARAVADQFPNELASRLPPKRKEWESEHRNMDLFEAVGLMQMFLLMTSDLTTQRLAATASARRDSLAS